MHIEISSISYYLDSPATPLVSAGDNGNTHPCGPLPPIDLMSLSFPRSPIYSEALSADQSDDPRGSKSLV